MSDEPLRDTMSNLNYPKTEPLMDRETIVRLDDLEKEIQTFRGLHLLWAQTVNGGDLPEATLRKAAKSQLWQIVYFALRLYDHTYPNAETTPHQGFARVDIATKLPVLEELQVQLAIAVDDQEHERLLELVEKVMNL